MKAAPPRKKPVVDPPDPEGVKGKRPGVSEQPAAAERTDDNVPAESRREPQQPAHTEQITNQDQQEKITNAEDNDQPVAEN